MLDPEFRDLVRVGLRDRHWTVDELFGELHHAGGNPRVADLVARAGGGDRYESLLRRLDAEGYFLKLPVAWQV